MDHEELLMRRAARLARDWEARAALVEKEGTEGVSPQATAMAGFIFRSCAIELQKMLREHRAGPAWQQAR